MEAVAAPGDGRTPPPGGQVAGCYSATKHVNIDDYWSFGVQQGCNVGATVLQRLRDRGFVIGRHGVQSWRLIKARHGKK